MTKLSNRSFTIIMASAVVLVGVTLMAITRGWFKRERPVAENLDKETQQEPLPADRVEIGGVRRPLTDVERKRNAQRQESPQGYHPGNTPKVNLDANANTKSVAKAIGDPSKSYRLTSMQPAPKFDRKAFEANPQAYLDEVVPGRINQSLPPSQDVAPIKRVGQYIHDNVLQGESVKLQVQVEKNMPVTFHSTRLGQFDNQLSTVTVVASEDGIAEANFRLSPGTVGEIDVRAASPVHSDVARWLVRVPRPQSANK